ncbi:hypothetical protein ACIGNX_28280 [Actinosynnema sp. NPDC053489]|uniref:CG0192-related protein n=1 Tax=Actinosynnema sp. NPDC053489 TaxID=3363916 RepID=UPI0037C7F386
MALIHRATLSPTKLELLASWLPGRGWNPGTEGEVTWVAAFRFDDPAGAVGIETALVRVGDGPVLQVPLTYRDAPLAGADEWLLGTSEHSVLGTRWCYDAIGDPVYAAALADAILRGTGQAEQFVDVDGRLERREPAMAVAVEPPGTADAPEAGPVERAADGDPAIVVTPTVELAVRRRLDTTDRLTGALLTGAWPGQGTPVPLASATVR